MAPINMQSMAPEYSGCAIGPPRAAGPPGQPSRASSSSADNPASTESVVCRYCRTAHLKANYNEHLLDAHTDLVFLCKECGKYPDRKKLVLHMSMHALRNAALKSFPKQLGKEELDDDDDSDENENEESRPRPASVERPERSDVKNEANRRIEGNASEEANENREDEFSDPSDMEYFGKLAESVLEAIEDTQDGRPTEDDPPANPTPEVDSRPRSAGPDTTEITPKAGRRAATKKSRTCPTCGKSFAASSSYYYHVKHAHNGSKEHECEVCGRKFGTGAGLRQHAPLHTGERNHACNEKGCGKRFGSRAGLYIHSQTHSVAKSCRCAECGRAFRWRAQLARHEARHAGGAVGAGGALACGRCGRGFSVRADLARHARTHEPARLPCARCHKHFAQPRYLKVHVAKMHAPPAPTAPRTSEHN